MRYMMFIKHTDEETTKSGNFIGGAGLQPTSAGTRVRLKSGKITVTDGPFTESKEIVGGYAIIEAKSRDAALAYARRFMDIHRKHWPTFEGECEMRPLEEEVQPAS
jgi:hypothetical protein